MYTYTYTSLPEGGLRILRLLPSPNQESRIECQLITSMLDSGRTRPYEALSYVWGSEDGKKPIYMVDSNDGNDGNDSNDSNDGNELRVTANLHVALLQLRHCIWERFLWIDAICINQGNIDEKNQQVQSMAKIYAKASRVIVWLGDAADNGDQALEAIRKAAQEEHTGSAIYESNQQTTLALPHQDLTDPSSNEANQAIQRLLQRPWFQRIWVLQEVAAARHVLVKCGSMEIEGYAFCSGIDALRHYHGSPGPSSLVRSVAYLMRGAGFRPRFENAPAGRFSLNIHPLSELVDMYHDRKATDQRDKVYALLGMSVDDPSAAGLSADYDDDGSPWPIVFRKLVRFCLPDQVSISTWGAAEVAVVEAKGCVLGEITSVREDNLSRNDRQVMVVLWKRAPSYSDTEGKQTSNITFRASAKTIKEGDVVCLLEGASTPTIVRLCDGFSVIIMITLPRTNDLPEWTASITKFPTNFLLVWDWDESPKSQGGKTYGDFIRSRGVPKCLMAGCECQVHLDEAARWWNTGMLLDGAERHKEAAMHFRKAVEAYGIGTELRGVDNTDLGHVRWRKEDENALRVTEELFIAGKGATIEAGYEEHGHTPLQWAAKKGCEAFIRLLIENGADIETKDRGGRTPLHLAAENGHQGVAKLLVEAGADKHAKYDCGHTPLHLAVLNEHQGIIKLLIKAGADKQARDNSRKTPLHLAAENGRKNAAKLLIEAGADEQAKNNWGQMPLHLAVLNGHEGIVRLLVEASADKQAKDNSRYTPLHMAASNGHEGIARLLIKAGADKQAKNYREQTPLHLAAFNGCEGVARLLVEAGADKQAGDNSGWTPLHLAASNGCEGIARLLVEAGADKQAKNNRGYTPLHLAALKGHQGVVKLLE